MEAGTGPYLVIRREDGYGDVISLPRSALHRWAAPTPIASSSRTSCAAASTPRSTSPRTAGGCAISRASTARASTATPIQDEWELVPATNFQIGRTQFMFVNQLDELPSVPLAAPGRDGVDQETPGPDALHDAGSRGDRQQRPDPRSRPDPQPHAASAATWRCCTGWPGDGRGDDLSRSWPTSFWTACSKRSPRRSVRS